VTYKPYTGKGAGMAATTPSMTPLFSPSQASTGDDTLAVMPKALVVCNH